MILKMLELSSNELTERVLGSDGLSCLQRLANSVLVLGAYSEVILVALLELTYGALRALDKVLNTFPFVGLFVLLLNNIVASNCQGVI